MFKLNEVLLNMAQETSVTYILSKEKCAVKKKKFKYFKNTELKSGEI